MMFLLWNLYIGINDEFSPNVYFYVVYYYCILIMDKLIRVYKKLVAYN